MKGVRVKFQPTYSGHIVDHGSMRIASFHKMGYVDFGYVIYFNLSTHD